MIRYLLALFLALLAGCGSVDTPRELYDAPTTCRSLSGECHEEVAV